MLVVVVVVVIVVVVVEKSLSLAWCAFRMIVFVMFVQAMGGGKGEKRGEEKDV
jgi:hypothetical protein